MNCRQIETELSAYLDGELPASQQADIAAHLAECGHCQQRLVEMRKLADGVAALPQLQPSPQFLGEVRARIRGQTEPAEVLQPSWIDLLFRPAWLKVPLEAVAVIAILVTAVVLMPPRRPSLDRASLKEQNQPRSPALKLAKSDAKQYAISIQESGEKASPESLGVGDSRYDGKEVDGIARRSSDDLTLILPGKTLSDFSKRESPGATVSALTLFDSANGEAAKDEGEMTSAEPVDREKQTLAFAAPQRDEVAASSTHLRHASAMETIMVASADITEVERQALNVARALNGNVYTLKQPLANAAKGAEQLRREPSVQSIFVQVPSTQVATFKEQFASLTTDKSRALAEAVAAPQPNAFVITEEKKAKEMFRKTTPSATTAVRSNRVVVGLAGSPAPVPQSGRAGGVGLAPGFAPAPPFSAGALDADAGRGVTGMTVIEIQVVPATR